MATVTSFGFVALVWFCGFGTGWVIRMIEDYCKEGEENGDY